MANNDPFVKEVVPVAEQKKAGVPADETVSVADQKQGASLPDSFNDDDRAELTKLREDRQARETAQREADEKAERERPEISHYLHLANGETVESAGTMTDYNGIAVIGSYPVEEREAAK